MAPYCVIEQGTIIHPIVIVSTLEVVAPSRHDCKIVVWDVLHQRKQTKHHQLNNQQNDMSLCMRKPTIWVPTRSDTNQAAQSQQMVRGRTFWNQKVEELYYPCSGNKGADQLRSYCEADLRLCFRLGRLLVLPCGGSIIIK